MVQFLGSTSKIIAFFQSPDGQWPLLVLLGFWNGVLLYYTFRRDDWMLVVFMLFFAITSLCSCLVQDRIVNATIFLLGVNFGRVNCVFFYQKVKPVVACLIWLLAASTASNFAALKFSFRFDSRWFGFWQNPNYYGMLMGAGTTLAIALQVLLSAKSKVQNPRSLYREKLTAVLMFIAIGMMGTGLVMSYSRGAWLATAVALTYLIWCYGKLKWRYIIFGAGILALVSGLFWGHTTDSAPWYIKRADLGRPSAQHRASAWRAGLEIMRDHPFGVGWNNAVRIFEKDYSPPEGGAPAITTNDYLMIGTELGIPTLFCFVVYTLLCLRGKPRIETEAGRIQAACRAGAIVFLVAFWFDGGLFKLATASVFWVLLELGTASAQSIAPTKEPNHQLCKLIGRGV